MENNLLTVKNSQKIFYLSPSIKY